MCKISPITTFTLENKRLINLVCYLFWAKSLKQGYLVFLPIDFKFNMHMLQVVA